MRVADVDKAPVLKTEVFFLKNGFDSRPALFKTLCVFIKKKEVV